MNRKALITSALIGLGILSQASASNEIYLTGSTAFRSRIYSAILALPGWSPAITAPQATFGGSSTAGSQYMLFHGTYNGVDTYVNCYWSGSEAGVASVASPGANPVTFLLETDTGINSGQPTTAQLQAAPQAPDICMADTSQTVSLTPSPKLVGIGTLGGTSDPGRVGIVTFTWAKNVNSTPATYWSAIHNITDSQARQLLAGAIYPALITGNPSDVGHYIYCIGRNAYSGTHVNTMINTKVGISFLPVQFTLGGYPHSNGTSFISGSDPTPATFTDLHNDGYDGGGDVAKALSIDGSCQAVDNYNGPTGFMAIGYLGMDDANNIGGSNNGPTYYLTLNGVAESDGAIEQGQYDYWNYEHMYGRTTIGTGYQYSFGNDLLNTVQGQLGGSVATAHSSGIALADMQCSKTSDQADPAHNP